MLILLKFFLGGKHIVQKFTALLRAFFSRPSELAASELVGWLLVKRQSDDSILDAAYSDLKNAESKNDWKPPYGDLKAVVRDAGVLENAGDDFYIVSCWLHIHIDVQRWTWRNLEPIGMTILCGLAYLLRSQWRKDWTGITVSVGYIRLNLDEAVVRLCTSFYFFEYLLPRIYPNKTLSLMNYTNYKLQTYEPRQQWLINAGYTAEHWSKGCHSIYLAGYHGMADDQSSQIVTASYDTLWLARLLVTPS